MFEQYIKSYHIPVFPEGHPARDGAYITVYRWKETDKYIVQSRNSQTYLNFATETWEYRPEFTDQFMMTGAEATIQYVLDEVIPVEIKTMEDNPPVEVLEEGW